MNLSLVPLNVLIIGGVLLAAVVTALSLLKVRRRRVPLASAVLWQQALRETPPRLLGGRFRRPLAWLLSLLLVLLLWLASGGPVREPTDDGRLHVFYLDASAWLQADGAFDAARGALEQDAARVPSSSREVVLGGQAPARIAAPGEAAALLHARLADAQVVTAPSGFERWLQQTAARVGEGPGIVVHYYGAAPVARRAATRLPAGVVLEPSHLAAPVAHNAGIVTLGASRAASGRWDAVDVLVSTEAVGTPRPDADALRWTLDDASWTPPPVRVVDGGLMFADVPATGGLLRVRLRQADAFPVDDSAALRLPLRRLVPVALGAAVPSTVIDAVRVDASLRIVEDPAQAQVQILAAGDAARADVPALWMDAEDAGAAFRFVAPDGAAQDEIVAGLGALGLDQTRNAALATELERAVGVDVLAGPQRAVHVWRALFAVDGSFVQSRAMPVFVNRSVHWLADEPWWSPYAAAGAPLRQDLLLQGLSQRDALRARALGDQVMLPDAGLHAVAGQELAVSLLDSQITRGVAGDVSASASPQTASPAWRWPGLVFLMLACALGLVCLEWVLLQRGRMP